MTLSVFLWGFFPRQSPTSSHQQQMVFAATQVPPVIKKRIVPRGTLKVIPHYLPFCFNCSESGPALFQPLKNHCLPTPEKFILFFSPFRIPVSRESLFLLKPSPVGVNNEWVCENPLPASNPVLRTRGHADFFIPKCGIDPTAKKVCCQQWVSLPFKAMLQAGRGRPG